MTEEYVISAEENPRGKSRVFTYLLAALVMLTLANTVALFLIYDRLSPITESAETLDEATSEEAPTEESAAPAEDSSSEIDESIPEKTSSSPNDA